MVPAYSATKAYQINYMEALRKKAFKAGGKVIVTDIRPGLVDTAMANVFNLQELGFAPRRKAMRRSLS